MGLEPLAPKFLQYSEVYDRTRDLLPRRLGKETVEEALEAVVEMIRPDHTIVAYLCVLANQFPEVVDEARSWVWRSKDSVMTPEVVVWEATPVLPSLQFLVRQMRLKYRESLDSIILSKNERRRLADIAKKNLSLR